MVSEPLVQTTGQPNSEPSVFVMKADGSILTCTGIVRPAGLPHTEHRVGAGNYSKRATRICTSEIVDANPRDLGKTRSGRGLIQTSLTS